MKPDADFVKSNLTADKKQRQALAGVTVLDWSQMVAGPYCARLLVDLGAEVIKIEKPGTGDEARHRSPFVHDTPDPERSLLFLYTNTSKLGVTLDVASPEGRERFLALVSRADILVEDNPPGVLEKMGLDYKVLSRLNPGLVVTSITPFGQTGPHHNYKAYPLNTYQSSGLGYLRVQADGVQTPLKLGGYFTEYACGIIAAVGTMGALIAQRASGLGQQVDLSKQEAILSLGRVQVDRYPNEKVIQNRLDARKSPGGNFRCKDGYVTATILQPHEWQAMTQLVSDLALTETDNYRDETVREQQREVINRRIADWMLSHTKEEIYHRGQAAGLPVTPVMTVKDITESPQTAARQFFSEVTHPAVGKLTYPGTPYRFSATPPTISRPAPLLGQHNDAIFNRQLPPAKAAANPPEGGQVSLPLKGIRVIDFSWAWAGPYATLLLTSLGAEVIKVESGKRLDVVRQRSFSTGQSFQGIDQSFVFNELNHGKKSVKLDLRQPKAVELAKKLVSRSNVVIQNMRPGAMERLGLDYPALKQVRPDIIYLSSSSRGTTGPERGYSGYASNFAALGGIAHVTGNPNGEPARMAGETDLLSGVTSAFAILSALHHHRQTGEGQHIDLSSTESVTVLIGDIVMDYLANDRVQGGKGNLDEFMAPHNCYPCRGEDKWVSIAVATGEEWLALCRVMAHPEWAEDERFATTAARWRNQPALDKLIAQWTTGYGDIEVMEKLQAVGVAAMPSFNAEELFHNPHLQERRCWTTLTHPVLGEQTVLVSPWKLSLTPPLITTAAPLLGEHTRQVFRELIGLTDDEITALEAEEVIA